MVTTRNRAGNPPPPPARPPTVFGSSRRRFAATPIIDIPSSSESGQNAAPDPPPPNIRLDRRAPRSPSFLHESSSDFSIPPRDSAGPSRPRPREPSPSDSFYSMPTMSHSQSMPDAYSAHSYVHAEADNPEVNSEPVDIAPLMVWHPVYGFSGSEFPNPPPQPSPEPTHSSRFRHSPPPSFAASFDGEDVDDDHTNSDYHARRRRGRAFAVPSDEVLQGYLDFDNEDDVRFRSIRHRRFQVYFDADAAYAALTHLPNATYNAKSTKGKFGLLVCPRLRACGPNRSPIDSRTLYYSPCFSPISIDV
ncbi:hypothetical protein V6N13_056216 [Hibiscus sabdariffa]